MINLQLEFMKTEFPFVIYENNKYIVKTTDIGSIIAVFIFENGIFKFDTKDHIETPYINRRYEKFIRAKRNEKLKILLG